MLCKTYYGPPRPPTVLTVRSLYQTHIALLKLRDHYCVYFYCDRLMRTEEGSVSMPSQTLVQPFNVSIGACKM